MAFASGRYAVVVGTYGSSPAEARFNFVRDSRSALRYCGKLLFGRSREWLVTGDSAVGSGVEWSGVWGKLLDSIIRQTRTTRIEESVRGAKAIMRKLNAVLYLSMTRLSI